MSKPRKGGAPRERWVVKVGSGTLSAGGPKLLASFVRQLAELRKRGIDVIWVTSGAIAKALVVLGREIGDADFVEKQALCAVGQPPLMEEYRAALKRAGLVGAQVLIVYHDVVRDEQRADLMGMFDLLLSWGVVPVVNENDLAIRRDRRFKDNDGLSALLAGILGAKRLVLCTDVDGLYDDDPRSNPKAKRIRELASVSEKTLAGARAATGSAVSAGGMRSKLDATSVATSQGIETWLVRGQTPNVLLKVHDGADTGTRVLAQRLKRVPKAVKKIAKTGKTR